MSFAENEALFSASRVIPVLTPKSVASGIVFSRVLFEAGTGCARDHTTYQSASPDYRWPELSAEQHAERIEILRAYEPAAEIANRLVEGVPDDLRRCQGDADRAVRKWNDFGENWSLTATPDANQVAMRESVNEAVDILKLLGNVGDQGTVLIPDTNALLKECDPAKYRVIADPSPFTFLLLPTVLAELDKLKVEHRNPGHPGQGRKRGQADQGLAQPRITARRRHRGQDHHRACGPH